MQVYPADSLERVLNLCKAYDVLCIADEVFTGFWKTGTCFASSQATVQPDILILSKALTAGSLPLAVLATTGRLFDAFVAPDRARMFLHGHTFTANPLGCAAACASLALMETDSFHENRSRVEMQQAAFAQRVGSHPAVAASRALGLVAAIDIAVSGVGGYAQPIRDELFAFCLERGVYLRPLGNTVYILPPVVMSDAELQCIYATIMAFLDMRVARGTCKGAQTKMSDAG
jgi:adenosylmethionine-8-amino-7-oxononanoate aminotransferase